jgi:hypothetical protein
MTAERRMAGYLRQLGKLCLECADRPALVPLLVGIIKLVPETLRELADETRRLAA